MSLLQTRNIIINKVLFRNNTTLSKANIVRPLILGIETSCDDTGAAIIDKAGTIFGECLHSQQSVHLRYGGIIPPVAQDLHRQNIERVVAETFQQSNLTGNDIDAIAVTNRPGLTLSLRVGVRYAKHLARTHCKPIIPIHHMEAHALTVRANQPDVEYPFLCLLASGGHCLLSFVNNPNNFQLFGESLDDAPGEAFDKIARRLKLRTLPQYEWISGGQAIEMAARESKNPSRFEFVLPLARQRNCQFSFAGLKNIARRHIERCELQHNLAPDAVMPEYQDFCAGLLRAVTRHICHRTQRAIEYCELKQLFPSNSTKRTLVFSGGVACNSFIFNSLEEMCKQFGYEVFRPAAKYCTDNGLMIAWNGVEQWLVNEEIFRNLDLDEVETFPKCPLGVNIVKDIENASVACKWAKISSLRS